MMVDADIIKAAQGKGHAMVIYTTMLKPNMRVLMCICTECGLKLVQHRKDEEKFYGIASLISCKDMRRINQYYIKDQTVVETRWAEWEELALAIDAWFKKADNPDRSRQKLAIEEYPYILSHIGNFRFNIADMDLQLDKLAFRVAELANALILMKQERGEDIRDT